MVTWILAAIVVYLINVFAPVMVYLPTEGILSRIGSRDSLPEPNALVSRLRRSLDNHKESLFIFFPLAILALVVPTADQAQAVLGAQIFVLARLAYMFVYAAVPFMLRTTVWFVGLIGLSIMALALV